MFHIVLQFLDDDFLLEWFQTVLFNQLRFFHIHPFIDWSNIFKNLFYVFVLFFETMALFLIIPPPLVPVLLLGLLACPICSARPCTLS